MRRLLSRAALAAALLAAGAVPAAGDPPPAPPAGKPPAPAGTGEPSSALTVYSSADPAGFDPTRFIAQQRAGHGETDPAQVPGFGVVKDDRDVDFVAGTSEIAFTDVAAFVDPTTVSFEDVTMPDRTTVLEQAFRFDLASPDKILERFVGERIAHEVRTEAGEVRRVEGTVLSVNQGTVVLRTSEGLRFIPARDAGLRLPALPSGLLTKPTLVWRVASEVASRRRIRTTYQTAGLTWRADYTLVLSADPKKADASLKADLGAWVSLLNLSGASYPRTRLKLVAGDVNRVQPTRNEMWDMAAAADGFAEGDRGGFVEKSFFEYHLYSLPRAIDVPANATQQIALFPTVTGADATRLLVYDGLPEAAGWAYAAAARNDRDVRPSSNPKVDAYVRFRNAKENRLGMPLPRGKVRVYTKDDADGTLEFVGEDLIDHTPKDETVLIKTGQSFDVVGERTQTEFRTDRRGKSMVEGYRITLRNHKEQAARVEVREHLFRWMNWDVISSSDPWTKVDAKTMKFEVDVPPNATKEVTYLVRYSW